MGTKKKDECLFGMGRWSHALSNTAVLCFVLGWQGGTVHQVALLLHVSVDDILQADDTRMGELCRKAQQYTYGQHPATVKALGACINALKLEYAGHLYPTWMQQAIEAYNKVHPMG